MIYRPLVDEGGSLLVLRLGENSGWAQPFDFVLVGSDCLANAPRYIFPLLDFVARVTLFVTTGIAVLSVLRFGKPEIIDNGYLKAGVYALEQHSLEQAY